MIFASMVAPLLINEMVKTMSIPQISPYLVPELPEIASVDWALETSRAALLIHDMQKYFVDAYDKEAEPINHVIEHIRRLVLLADELRVPVFYSAQPPGQHRVRRGLLGDMWGEGMATSKDAEIICQLKPKPHHVSITKWRYSAFERTDLEHALRFAKRDQLLITGVYGHMGCMVTAVDAFMKDIQPFIVGDAIGDFSAEEHANMMRWVAKRCGVVLSTEMALAQISSSH